MAADDNDMNDEMLEPSEALDGDELGAQVEDTTYDAPEQWSAASRDGLTEREELEGESLDDKLAEERPDVAVEEQPDRPVGATGVEDLDATIDERVPEQPGPLEESALEDAAGEEAVVREERPNAPEDVHPA